MFEFIKKKVSDKKADMKTDFAIKLLIQDYKINNASLETMVTNISHVADTLTLDLSLAEDVNPEILHQQLGQQLSALGIKELNFNISIPASNKHSYQKQTDNNLSVDNRNVTDIKEKGKKLPKTINAGATVDIQTQKQTNSKEPPITKRAPTQASIAPHPRIKHIIVVASGKGGVGKSTTTVNIALALQKLGKRVGVLDADIYGPSIPTMLGVEGIKPALENEQFVPIDAHGMPILSIGSLLDSETTPVAWRGPKATGALMQLFNQTNWPNLDYLVIDMPPGTGDIQLTLAQRIPVTGAIIVTTPQHIALMDAQKGIEMFNKTSIPVIGVVENMALHTCSNCGHTEAIFGIGGGENIAKQYQVPLLGQLPLASSIREQADKGEPSVIANGDGDDFAKFYISIAKNIEANIAKFSKQRDDGRIF